MEKKKDIHERAASAWQLLDAPRMLRLQCTGTTLPLAKQQQLNSGGWKGGGSCGCGSPTSFCSSTQCQPRLGWGLTWRHCLPGVGGVSAPREEEGQRAVRGRKTQWIANHSPDQEHEHSHLINSHFINLSFHSCSCLPTRTCRDNVQSNEKEQICGKIGPHN